jgi:RNA polymerase sigma-70 factor (ECF subfamily)
MKLARRSPQMSSKISDAAVVERILEGEKQWYEILMRRYNQTLYRTVRSYLPEPEVEDIMQDTYLKAFEKLHQFQGNASFSTWLIRIGINEALQHLRRKRNKHVVSMDQDDDLNHHIIQLTDTQQMDPEKRTIGGETRLLLEKAIDHLPEKYRIVYTLREMEGFSNADVAMCLDITESNAKVRLHRARFLLKEYLFQQSGDALIWEFGNSRCDELVDKILCELTKSS